jgi:transposase
VREWALVAVGHSILRIVYHMLKYNLDFQELGADYSDKFKAERLQRQPAKRLEALGLGVIIEPEHAAWRLFSEKR